MLTDQLVDLTSTTKVVLLGYFVRLCLEIYSRITMKQNGLVGGPGKVRTLDLMTARQSKLGYFVDFAARLATQND